jgi:bifunctional UDP-N-acetylglucosamine pyrophosphorylase / glucosamine-1-phosphate N-acetyltransferase
MSVAVVVMAAGQGLRMQSTLPKVLHPIGGIPMLEHVLINSSKLNTLKTIIVHGKKSDQLKAALSHYPKLLWAEQSEAKGTGHAVLQALPLLDDLNDSDKVLILSGDVPFVSSQILTELLNLCQDNSIGLITAKANPPTGYGRILRNAKGEVIKIVEEKDANHHEKEISEINAAIYLVPRQKLQQWLPKLQPKNAQNEYYLTDIIDLAVKENIPIHTLLATSSLEALGINDRLQLNMAERHYQKTLAENLMKQGVTIYDPLRLDIRGKLTAGKDVIIDVNVIFEGDVLLEDNVQIAANVIIKNSTIKRGSQILPNTLIDGAIIGPNASIGPFARVRPGSEINENAKVGNFVETKNVKLGKDSKINHLSYAGDATIGEHVNIGAGTITCNYDGVNKHHTTIGDRVLVGSNTQLIAPVTIGENSTIGAGTTIVKDVPPNHIIHNRITHRLVSKEK